MESISIMIFVGLFVVSEMGIVGEFSLETKTFSSHLTRHLLANETAAEPDKSFFDKVKEFYDDKNNFAMYLVLPIIVIVYGGCSLIYCIAKCRRYFKRKRHPKPLTEFAEDDDDETTDVRGNNIDDSNSGENSVNRGGNTTVAAAAIASSNRPQSKARSASDIRVVELEKDENITPLPWQVVDDKETLYPTKKNASHATNNHRSYDNPAFNDHPNNQGRHESPKSRNAHAKSRAEPRHREPPQENQRNSESPPRNQMQLSPPPPYEDHGAEFIPLGIAGASVQKRERPNMNGSTVQQQRSRDPTRARNAMESYNMAKQAAELLRLDEQTRNGGRGFKKPKRLVFVAE